MTVPYLAAALRVLVVCGPIPNHDEMYTFHALLFRKVKKKKICHLKFDFILLTLTIDSTFEYYHLTPSRRHRFLSPRHLFSFSLSNTSR